MPLLRSLTSPPPGSTPWSHLAQRLTLLSVLWLVVQSTITWTDAHTEPWRWWALAVSTEAIVVLTLGSLLAWRGGRWLRRIGWGLVALASLSMIHHGLRAAVEVMSTWRHGG
ncbi:MAG TPA: hypothetical protein VNU46_02870 [Gemmatimonadaceae bacterium]|jgi:hypothetical protein|nr:hypothetical protein [Gemmatimonadaceae bacterium]